MVCKKDCGWITCIDGKCECFNKKEGVVYNIIGREITPLKSTDYLLGNPKFIEAYTTALKESGLITTFGKLDKCSKPQNYTLPTLTLLKTS